MKQINRRNDRRNQKVENSEQALAEREIEQKLYNIFIYLWRKINGSFKTKQGINLLAYER